MVQSPFPARFLAKALTASTTLMQATERARPMVTLSQKSRLDVYRAGTAVMPGAQCGSRPMASSRPPWYSSVLPKSRVARLPTVVPMTTQKGSTMPVSTYAMSVANPRIAPGK